MKPDKPTYFGAIDGELRLVIGEGDVSLGTVRIPVLGRQFTTGIHIESDFAGLRNLVQELLNQDKDTP